MRKIKAPIERIAYTAAEAAASIGCGPDHFDEYYAPHLRVVRQGQGKGKRLYLKADIEALLVEMAEPPIAEQVRDARGAAA